MGEKRLKNIFLICSALLLGFILLMSRNAGVTCDEVLHYQQSVAVYNFYASHGKDLTALNTPVTHLKYYGQSYDNLVTILINWFDIKDIYGFRHIMSSLAGWLTVLITAMFAVWIAGYGTGVIVLLLFALSPTFLGHTQNNLKDIPFALAYITGTFYTLKFLFSGSKSSFSDIILLTLSVAFCISIRAGGLLLICYLFFFFVLFYLLKYLLESKIDLNEIQKKLIWIFVITIVAFFFSILLWPYALQNPIVNVLKSYHVITHYPDTFRQVFEGKVEWSDYMPWYYLIKSMAITIPIIVMAGLIIFIILSKRIFNSGKGVIYGFLVFTVLFPVVFVIFEKSNLYSSWRQFLFIYPGIVLLASTGFNYLLQSIKSKYSKWGLFVLFILFSIHPVKFMISNHQYSYMYYNQIAGGLKGAYGNYETDYYYVSLKEGSQWLLNYLKEKGIDDSVRVGANFSVQWFFRNHPEIENDYFRYEERSLYDWDYAIVANRYFSPFQLKNKIWPPENAIKIIYADEVPVCAILERKTKNDYYGSEAMKRGQVKDAIQYFENAIKINDRDEMIYYNFACALFDDRQTVKADSALRKSLEVNPDFEPALMYLGNVAAAENKADEAISFYETLIEKNRKCFEAYVELSKLLVNKDKMKARDLLRTCLMMSPKYRPAIVALADTYRQSDPGIAKRYDDLANTIEQNK